MATLKDLQAHAKNKWGASGLASVQLEAAKKWSTPSQILGFDVNSDVLNQVRDAYKQKYSTDYNSNYDSERMASGKIPTAYDKKYKQTPQDLWLYDQGLPSASDLGDYYNKAVDDYNAKAKYQGNLSAFKNELFQKLYNATDAWKAQGGAYPDFNWEEAIAPVLAQEKYKDVAKNFVRPTTGERTGYDAVTDMLKGSDNKDSFTQQDLIDAYNQFLAQQPKQTISQLRRYDQAVEELSKPKIGDLSRMDNANANPVVVKTQSDAAADPQFEQYAAKGAAVKNPSWFESKGGPNFFGWQPFAKDIPNKVEFYLQNTKAGGNEAYEFMTEQEKQTYNYLLGKYGTEQGDKYLEQLHQTLTARKSRDFKAQAESDAIKSPILAGAASVALTAGKGLGYLYTAGQSIAGKPVDPNATPFLVGQAHDTIRQAGGATMNGRGEIPLQHGTGHCRFRHYVRYYGSRRRGSGLGYWRCI